MVRKFVDKEINPNIDEWEEKTVPLHELFKKMSDLGLLGITYDPKYGGQGLDYWFDLVFLEELGHIKAGGVPMAIAGDMVSAIGVTEPGAGSDVASLKTRAVKDGNSYVINGSKLYITNGCQADFVTLLARTDDKPGFHSFGLFVAPTSLPGFVVSKKLDKLGMRCSDTAELFFDDMRVPQENLVGEEGAGFIIQMKQFQHERFSALPGTYISARDTIDMTINYIRQRTAFGRPLIKNQVLRHRLVDWITEIECLKHLTYHIVRLKMEGLDATREISMGKLLAGELSFKVANGCLQMFGGMGYMNESLISRNFRDQRLLSIGGGADEIMKEVIARLEGF